MKTLLTLIETNLNSEEFKADWNKYRCGLFLADSDSFKFKMVIVLCNNDNSYVVGFSKEIANGEYTPIVKNTFKNFPTCEELQNLVQKLY